MLNPLISIVLPTYNHAHFLDKAIQSVLSQDYDNWELLIIDNHSNDNTDEIISLFPDKRIRVLKIYNDGVIAASRNFGILESKGEWIAFLDSDDFWYSNKLMEVINAIKTYSKGDVFCHSEVFVNENNGHKKVHIIEPITSSAYETLLVEGNKLSTSATVISKKFLKTNDLHFREKRNLIAVEDYDFWLLCAKNSANFYFLDSILGEYRMHTSNESQINVKYFNNLFYLIKDHCFKQQQFTSQKKKLYKLVHIRVTLSLLKQLFRKRLYHKFLFVMCKTLLFNFRTLINFFFRKSIHFI